MLWEITGANSQTGAPVFFYLDAPGEGEAREAVGDIGVLAERVSRADVSLPSPQATASAPQLIELRGGQVKNLRTTPMTIGLGILLGWIFIVGTSILCWLLAALAFGFALTI